MSNGLCQDRIAVVTGAGRGLGRSHAMMLAAEGAKVVVNDVGGDVHGNDADAGPAEAVAAEITAAGGTAVANTADISSWSGAESLIQQAIDTFGGIDVVVNNAGIVRDRMLATMSEEEWDRVIDVNLKGTFLTSRHAAGYWRSQVKGGAEVSGRIINTSSPSGIYGNVGQTNYGASKAGVATFTITASRELANYGVTVNAIAPMALSRMTESLGDVFDGDEGPVLGDPALVSSVVTYLASADAGDITGRVFTPCGAYLAVADGWRRGPSTDPVASPAEVGPVMRSLLADALPNCDMNGLPLD